LADVSFGTREQWLDTYLASTDEEEQRFAVLLAFARLGFSLERLADLAGNRPASRTSDEAGHAVGSS
jgi:hypothetical protein